MSTSPNASASPGVLCFDPNPTTAKLATATLRLAGYEVYSATSASEAVELVKAHGSEGDGSLTALLLDTAADPQTSTEVLRAIVQLPGATELPGILIVNRRNPTPIPGAEALPTIRRPFSSPALLKVVREALADNSTAQLPTLGSDDSHARESQLARVLAKVFPSLEGELEGADEKLAELLAALQSAEELPSFKGEDVLRSNVSSVRLEALLEMLANDGASGQLEVQDEKRCGILHIDEGFIRLAEYRGDDEDLKLGRFVVEAGFMQDAELEAFIIGRDPEGRPLGQRLVDGGFLTSQALAQTLIAQAREVTCHLLTRTQGTISFQPTRTLHPMAAAAAEEGEHGLSISEALLEGLRRLEEKMTMGPHMPQVDEIYIRLDDKVSEIGRDTFSREELTVLELVNGRNSVKEIARKTRTGTFAVARVLYRLDRSQVVRRRVTPVAV